MLDECACVCLIILSYGAMCREAALFIILVHLKCVRMDEFLHAKEGVMMLTTEQHTRPSRASKL